MLSSEAMGEQGNKDKIMKWVEKLVKHVVEI